MKKWVTGCNGIAILGAALRPTQNGRLHQDFDIVYRSGGKSIVVSYGVSEE